jgi:hypothetical protein
VDIPGNEAIEMLESKPGRPLTKRPRGTGLVIRNIVVLADKGRVPAIAVENAPDRCGAARNHTLVPWKSGGHVGDDPSADHVVVASGQHGSAGR